MKVLFHIDDGSNWALALGNIQNMLQYGRDAAVDFQIELVANGPAVVQFQEATAREAGYFGRMEELAQAGVSLCACNNALRANGIELSALCSFVTVVPAGVVEIAFKQQDGYAYIKP